MKKQTPDYTTNKSRLNHMKRRHAAVADRGGLVPVEIFAHPKDIKAIKRVADGLALARGIGRSQFDPRRYNPNAKGGDIYGLPYRLPTKAIKD